MPRKRKNDRRMPFKSFHKNLVTPIDHETDHALQRIREIHASPEGVLPSQNMIVRNLIKQHYQEIRYDQ